MGRKNSKRATGSIAKNSKNTSRRKRSASSAGFAQFEQFESRRMLSTVNVADFGAKPNDGGDDRGAIQAAINASNPGDTIKLNAGAYDVNGTLTIDSGRTLDGGSLAGKLNFHVGSGQFGIQVGTGRQTGDVTIKGIDITGGGIFLGNGSQYTNVNVLDNHINANGTPGVKATVNSDGLKVQGNYFHDYEDYGLIVYNTDHLNVTKNTFVNVQQGAHIVAPMNDNTVSFNLASGLTRMMFEIQRNGNVIAKNLTVEGNVASDWKSPYRDSFGLSIVADGSINTRVINNYLVASLAPGASWNPQTKVDGQGERFGYGIEYGAASGEVSGNTIAGPFINHVVVSGGNGSNGAAIRVTNNKFFGKPKWGANISTEAGGAYPVDQENLRESDMSKLPGAPKKLDGSVSGTRNGGTDRSDAPLAPVSLSANWSGDSLLALTWNDQSRNEDGFRVEKSTDGQTWTLIGKTRGESFSIEATDLADYQIRVRAYNDSGRSYSSNTVTPGTAPVGLQGGVRRPVTYLSDLDWTSATNGWGPVEKDITNGERDSQDGAEINLNGTAYDKGLGVAGASEIVYDINGKYAKFFSDIGVDDSTDGDGSVTFQVYADGKQVFDSGVIKGDDKAQRVSLDVSGVKQLKLVTTTANDGDRDDHADWAGARVVTASDMASNAG